MFDQLTDAFDTVDLVGIMDSHDCKPHKEVVEVLFVHVDDQCRPRHDVVELLIVLK